MENQLIRAIEILTDKNVPDVLVILQAKAGEYASPFRLYSACLPSGRGRDSESQFIAHKGVMDRILAFKPVCHAYGQFTDHEYQFSEDYISEVGLPDESKVYGMDVLSAFADCGTFHPSQTGPGRASWDDWNRFVAGYEEESGLERITDHLE